MNILRPLGVMCVSAACAVGLGLSLISWLEQASSDTATMGMVMGMYVAIVGVLTWENSH